MLFPTLDFAVFFAIAFTFCWLFRRTVRLWVWGMLAASWFFYGYWDWRFVGLLFASSVLNHLAASKIYATANKSARRGLLALAVVINLSPLVYFKYSAFFAQQIYWLVSNLPGFSFEASGESWLSALNYLGSVILPVGISFFTFQALSYVIDVYRGQMRPAKSWVAFALYLAFFPQLVAGPIVRARDLLEQLTLHARPPRLDVGRAAFLILGGLFKKIVVANFLADQIVDKVFARPDLYGAWDTLFAIYGYAIQIYCDFSAYSDIAIGLCLLMGFHIPINFDAPYLAGSIQLFWRRWHISLSSFLRDYLYIPLGGSRQGEVRTYYNLFITFLLGGLWHGAGWTFIIWGALHGFYLASERLLAGLAAKLNWQWSGIGAKIIRGLLVWHLVCFAWLFFRGQSFSDVMTMLKAFSLWQQPIELTGVSVLAILCIGYLTQLLDGRRRERLWDAFANWHPILQGAAAAVVLTIILGLGPKGVAPFIYFQF